MENTIAAEVTSSPERESDMPRRDFLRIAVLPVEPMLPEIVEPPGIFVEVAG